jgi:hypothetical protein
MTGPVPFFGFSCWPGARSAASVVEVSPGRLGLSVHLDPIDWVLNIPPFPGGDRYMARFMRQMSRAAADLADQLEAMAEPAKHAASGPADTSWFGDRNALPGGDQ